YALGCVAYWLLTGREVFGGPTALAVLMKHGRETPPPLTGGVEPVPADLNAVVLQRLEKDPAGQWTQEDAERWWTSQLPEGKASRGESAEAPVKSAELVVRAQG